LLIDNNKALNSLLFKGFLVKYSLGDVMKKLGNGGWGLSAMVGFMIAFAIFLIIIVILAYRAGL